MQVEEVPVIYLNNSFTLQVNTFLKNTLRLNFHLKRRHKSDKNHRLFSFTNSLIYNYLKR